jgi:hypothetical protein
MLPEMKIRYQSLLVALKALDGAGEDITVNVCDCGNLYLEGRSGSIQYDPWINEGEGAWVFDGVDGTEMYV